MKTNVKVLRESISGHCWHDYRLVFYRGFYRVQEKIDETWVNQRSKLLAENEAITEFNQYVACNLKPEHRNRGEEHIQIC